MSPKDRDIQRKLKILKHAVETGHVGRTCRYFGIGRDPAVLATCADRKLDPPPGLCRDDGREVMLSKRGARHPQP